MARCTVLDALKAALDDSDPLVRVAAVEALARLRPAGRPILAALGKLVRDADQAVRARAAMAIDTIRKSLTASLDIPPLSLSPAFGAGSLDVEGTTPDGRLAFAITEADDHTLELRFQSDDPVLDGARLRLRIGDRWSRDVVLAMVSSGSVEGFPDDPAVRAASRRTCPVDSGAGNRRDGRRRRNRCVTLLSL